MPELTTIIITVENKEQAQAILDVLDAAEEEHIQFPFITETKPLVLSDAEHEALDLNSIPRVKHMPTIELKMLIAMVAGFETLGYRPVLVWDGEEYTKVTTLAEAITLMDAVELSNIRIENDKGDGGTVAYIMGEGVDCIVDYSYSPAAEDDFSKVIGEVYDASERWAAAG